MPGLFCLRRFVLGAFKVLMESMRGANRYTSLENALDRYAHSRAQAAER